MDDIYYEKILNRIIQGRLRLKLGDLVLFIHDPSHDLIEESFDIYDESYNRAYYSGVYVKREILEILLTYDLWSPLDDKRADEIEKQIEELKVQAFLNFYSSKKLKGIKQQLRYMEKEMIKYKMKKMQLDHVTCAGVAHFARRGWLLSKTTTIEDGSLFDFSSISLTSIMEIWNKNTIITSDMRKLARMNTWRQMWSSSKKRGNVFGTASCNLSENQLHLTQFSLMYDNVYESGEAPQDKVIEDDDCLDGWFIVQRRKHEKDRKEREVEDMIQNPKIKDSDEIFLVAKDQEHAQEIYGLNDPMARNVVKQRQQKFKQGHGENVKFTEFDDVKMEAHLQRAQQGNTKMSSMGRRK